ncbi:dimethylaniline monooxygenase 3 [Aspergillus granulosus]|uniref:Dimethylaniline monooxygenase 3 n=1 Tax=Aspergillus granulosus TaxID=176169 RepID=A0ABR4HFE2_9EURO
MAEVAVIGAGAAGLPTLKNLLEEGFKATAFDRDTEIGGIWNLRDDGRPSVLESTVANNSSDFGCYTDFPYPNGSATYPSAREVSQYLQAYADHFELLPHIRLGTTIRRARLVMIGRIEKWELAIETGRSPEELLYFDKLVVASGSFSTPSRPDIPGLGQFEGLAMHSSAYKRPAQFNGLRVLVVGTGNTAADVVSTLKGHAKQVYWSHRHGALILPRSINGMPLDHTLTYRSTRISDIVTSYFPRYASRMMIRMLEKIQNTSFQIRPEWGLTPVPALQHALPIITDDLVAELEAGRAVSVPRIKRVTGKRAVELEDDSRLNDIDAIVLCTGYRKTDWALVGDELDPTRHTTARWSSAKGSGDRPLPRLYQNVFSLERPQSLAYVGIASGLISGFTISDLTSMAIAQVWKGNSALPTLREMNEQVDAHHDWLCKIAEHGSCSPHALNFTKWTAWVHETAGTGVHTKLGYGIQGWWFWLKDRAFCNVLMTGVMSPFIFRVFPGAKRKAWDGAREAIEVLNAERKGRIFRWHGRQDD